MAAKVWRAIALSIAVLIAALILMPLIGSARIDYGRALAGMSPDREILFQACIPRVLLAGLAGGTLALAGVIFQALLRNALAEPYTLGIASGSSLGAVAAICFGWQVTANLPAVWISAFLGAVLVLFVVVGIASEARHLSSFTLLLAGVTINSICIAMILFLQNLATIGQAFSIMRWLMGGIEVTDYSTITALAFVLLPACLLLFWYARQWNLLAVGEEFAAARGISTSRLMLAGYLSASLITGCVTALTGPIGFVGLIVPHAIRLRFGADHRLLIPCSFFLGAAFLAVCDTLARTILAPTEVPVGVITALMGGPFFLWLLRHRRSVWR
jgi:iron complex transport system permease protein